MVSQKGGVGKSTLCQLIVREAAAGGKSAKILDFDIKQTSSTDWVGARLENGLDPVIEAEPIKNIGKALKQNGYIIGSRRRAGSPQRTAEADLRLVISPQCMRAGLVPTLALARRIAEITSPNVRSSHYAGPDSGWAWMLAPRPGSGSRRLAGELVDSPAIVRRKFRPRRDQASFSTLNDKGAGWREHPQAARMAGCSDRVAAP